MEHQPKSQPPVIMKPSWMATLSEIIPFWIAVVCECSFFFSTDLFNPFKKNSKKQIQRHMKMAIVLGAVLLFLFASSGKAVKEVEEVVVEDEVKTVETEIPPLTDLTNTTETGNTTNTTTEDELGDLFSVEQDNELREKINEELQEMEKDSSD